MRKLKLFLAVLSMFAVSFANAQNITVKGTVTDQSGAPLIGAYVLLQGSTQGTSTDVDGNYEISAPSNGILVFSLVGMKDVVMPINGKAQINVTMEEDSEMLEDVIVVGYGSARKVGTTVGSITKVSSKSIEARPQSSALESLQGQVPGLQVYTSSGDPGTQQSIRLHGIGSLTASNTPLYILDGVAVEARTILAMNPNDIESINVLKDASATSIYGSRAANGVIYVTSKRGSTGNAVIKVRGQYGVSSMADKSFHNAMMSTDQLLSFWEETGMRSAAYIENLKNTLKKNGITQADGSLHNFRWIDYMQKDDRPSWQADLSISGGSKNSTYYVSAGAYDEQGTAPGSYFKRYTLRSNTDSRVTDWMRFGTNIQLTLDKRQRNSQYGGTSNSNSTAGGLSFLRQPYFSPYDKDGNEPDITPGTTWANPNYYMDTHADEYKRYGINVNAYVELEPVQNLKIKSVAGIDEGLTRNSWKYNPSYLDRNSGTRGESTEENMGLSITNTIEYAMKFNEKHNVTVLAGQEGIQNKYEYFYATSDGQTDDRLLHLQNGLQSTFDIHSEDSEYQFLSFFGRADYSFDNRVFVDASLRNDASSRFSKNHKNAMFWAVGAMWNLKNEQFLKNTSWLNSLQFKVSYGTQGNAGIGNYASLATVGETTKYNQAAGWVLANSGNPDLTWETQTKLTIAVNTRVFDRLNVGVEYYKRTTNDMLMDVPIPYTTGYSEITKNTGTLVNNGVDITLGYDILKGKDYYLGFNFNFNYNSEKITELFDGRKRWEIANTGVCYVVGEPIMYYYPIFAGINPENGRQQWYIPGENIDETTKDPNRVTETFNSAALTQNTGIRRYAPVSGGFNINGTWRGFGISADFSYVLGKNLISNDRYFSENPVNFIGYNTSSNVLDYWKNPGDIVEYPDWSKGPTMQFDTHLVEKASFMRLKNLTLSYTLPSKFIKNSNVMKGARVYLTGRNLWTVKDKSFKGTDPEIDSNLTYGKVVNTKQYQVGLEITF